MSIVTLKIINFLDSLVDNYKFHNKPHIRMKGGTLMRRAPLAPSNQGQAIRGQHPTFCIVDESPLIDDSLFVDNVEPAIVSNKAPFINLGTPKSQKRITCGVICMMMPIQILGRRLWFTWRDAVDKVGDSYEAAYTEEDMLEKMMEWGEDSMYWRTEYECEFVESVSNIFNPEKIKACFHDYELYHPEESPHEGGKWFTNYCGLLTLVNLLILLLLVDGTEKADDSDVARLIYMWKRLILELADMIFHINVSVLWILLTNFGVGRLIVDCTGIGGAIEQDLRIACINCPSDSFYTFHIYRRTQRN